MCIRDSSLTSALLQLDQTLDALESTDLGESDQGADSPKPHAVDERALRKAMDVEAGASSAQRVKRVLRFLAHLGGSRLTRQELAEIRQFYVDQTAGTLARYGFDQSPYGTGDVSSHKSDSAAATRHMDQQDAFMHTEGASSDASKANVQQLVQDLKETARLSNFLDRVAQNSQRLLSVPASPKSESERQELESVQSDEERVTTGIEKLLQSIRVGANTRFATNEEAPDGGATGDSLQTRAGIEEARLDKLKQELKKQHTTPTKAAVRVPLPALQQSMNRVISAQLDRTLERFSTMKASGDTVDPALRATIEHYMGLITSRLLQTCVSYEQWNDPAGVADEARAVQHGSPEGLSKAHRGTRLSSNNLVNRFLQAQRQRPQAAEQMVPISVQNLMMHGVELAGVGRLLVTIKT
eukprot:TRINITY_DN3564_c0_g1_i2.p1 TRINITY_DN3564_c0_g1~~TRINITY_DN3564_c0_g1_i2.p1  ORF type:complete len:412 (+),score=82.36 TRINITY_DN3564_c0_g1_i2:77-1312(+)